MKNLKNLNLLCGLQIPVNINNQEAAFLFIYEGALLLVLYVSLRTRKEQVEEFTYSYIWQSYAY